MMTAHDARNERHAAKAALDERAARREAPARALAEFNASERAAALADSRVGLLTRKGRVVAYAFAGAQYVEGTVAQVLEALNA